MKKNGMNKPSPVRDDIHYTDPFLPDAGLPLQLRNQIGGKAYNKIPDTLNIVKESLAKQPKVTEKPAEPSFWDKFKKASFGLGRGAAMTDINPKETYNRDAAVANKTPPSGQAFPPSIAKRSNLSFGKPTEKPVLAVEPTKAPVVETPPLAEATPPVDPYDNKNVSVNGTADKRHVNLGAKVNPLPPANQEILNTGGKPTAPSDPSALTAPHLLPSTSVEGT